MGCGSSADVVSRIKDQDKKIDNLIDINRNLQKRLNEINANNANEAKPVSDNGDATSLRTTIDFRFNKLEKNVEKMHNEFKVKVFEEIFDNLQGSPRDINRRASLSLNFEKEYNGKNTSRRGDAGIHWNEILNDSDMTPRRMSVNHIPITDERISQKQMNLKTSTKNYIDHDDIQMDLNVNIPMQADSNRPLRI